MLISFYSCNDENILEQTSVKETFTEETPKISQYDTTEYNSAIGLITNFEKLLSGNTKSASIHSISLKGIETVKFNNVSEKSASLKNEPFNDSINIYTFDIQSGDRKGFAIVSGDKRVGRIYAYVPDGSLSDTSDIQGMYQAISSIPDICKQDLILYDEGDTIEVINKSASTTADDDPFGSVEEIYGPLLTTEWHQGSPYNYATPTNGACSYNYYYPVGCGVLATSQAIAYYGKYSSNYDFDALTAQNAIYTYSSSYLKNQVSSFIGEVGESCNAEYGCEGTSTNIVNCKNVLLGFGYDLDYQPYSYRDKFLHSFAAYDCFKHGDLVLVRGEDSDEGGHMWVYDGCYKIRVVKAVYYTGLIHCNWGQGENGSNGWYTSYFRYDNDTNFEYYNHFIYMREYH